jgi:hypothetical protein
MPRSGDSLGSIVAVGAALVVALLGGLSSVPNRPDRPDRPDPLDSPAPAGTARIRIGVYDPGALPLCDEASLPSLLAAVAERADVVAITARADFETDSVELVDVTGALAAALRSGRR